MKKLEDFLVTGLYEDIDEPSTVALTAYTKKYKKQFYNILKRSFT